MTAWAARQRFLLDHALSTLWRRKGKNLGLVTVYALVVFLLASVTLFSHALKREAALILEAGPEVLVQRMVMGRHDLIPESHLKTVRAIRGVRAVEGRLWGYFFDPVTGANYTFTASAGRGLAPGEILIGNGLARARGADPGSSISFRGAGGKLFPFDVKGVLDPGSELVSADLLLLTPETFRAFFGLPPHIFTDLAVTVGNPREAVKIAEKIAARLPDARPILKREILRTYDSLFDWRSGMVLTLLVGALGAFVIFTWDRASGLSAEERREIGILKAIGWETGDILRMKTWEGAAISLTAFFLGWLLAYLHVFSFGAPLFEQALKGWSTLYPRYALTPVVDGFQLTTLFLLTVLPYSLAVVAPVWRAATADPDAVMR